MATITRMDVFRKARSWKNKPLVLFDFFLADTKTKPDPDQLAKLGFKYEKEQKRWVRKPPHSTQALSLVAKLAQEYMTP